MYTETISDMKKSLFRLLQQYAKICKRHWKIISLLCVLFVIAIWKFVSRRLYIREGAKGCNVNQREVNSVVINNRQRLGPLLKKANGQSAKVNGIKKQIEELKKDMKKTSNKVTEEAKATEKPK